MNFDFVGRVYQRLKGLYNGINPATLTGAIDVVIIKQEDGSYLSSPFHVRFGKLGVLRSREKVVDIEINGEATDLHMKLGEAGEAFFVLEVESEEENVPEYLATSPLPSAIHLMEKNKAKLGEPLLWGKDPRSDSSWDEAKASGKPRRKVLKKKKQKTSKSSTRSVSMPENVADEETMFEMEFTNSSEDDELSISRQIFTNMRSTSSPQIKDIYDEMQGTTSHRRMSSLSGSFVTPFSDPETSPIGSPLGSRPSTPKSDTEVDKQHSEESQNSALMESSATWQWGEFPKKAEPTLICIPAVESKQDSKDETSKSSGGFMSMWSKSKNEKKDTVTGGIYLDDLASLDDPEMARIYLGRPREEEEDTESGRGQSLPQSPNSVEGAIGGPVSFTPSEIRHLGPVSLSLCGGLHSPGGVSLDKFMQKVVTFEDLAEHPNITTNPDLVVKIHDKFYNWVTAGPMVLSQIVFHKQLPEPAVKDLEREYMPKKEKKKKKTSWFSWGRAAEAEADPESGPVNVEGVGEGVCASASTTTLTEASQQNEMTTATLSSQTSPLHSESNTPRKQWSQSIRLQQDDNTSTETDTESSEKETSKSSSPPKLESKVNQPSKSVPVKSSAHLFASESREGRKHEKYIKSLRLSTEQISKMNLREGHNEISFSVTTQYQGTTRCVAHVYLWRYDDKIVISDIDGTITKSDVFGQILPMIGRDWSQSGVAELFTRITGNGYKLIYLSARAIGQSRSTKDLLKNIKQGNLALPEGPMFLNPTSLFSAFHRELIVGNPEEFKISCLKDIADLFPSSPFYAGFGNKLNDVIAYRALNIPNFRIFTINPQGQLRHDLSFTFLSSYAGMSDIVDHFFPSMNYVDRGTNLEFNRVIYWRHPIAQLSEDDLACVSEVSKDKEKK